MNSYLVSDKPIIYADMNVFRYLACGDIFILEPERFRWVYSHVVLGQNTVWSLLKHLQPVLYLPALVFEQPPHTRLLRQMHRGESHL